MSSGIRVPSPRTCRTIGPRLTVSTQTVDRSTLGTAGFNREIAIVARIKPSADPAVSMMGGLRFFAATPGRGWAVGKRVGAKAAGRTILWSVGFRSGITVSLGSKQRENAKEVGHREDAGHDRHYCHHDERASHSGFSHKLPARFSVKIIPADIAQ